MGMASGKCTHVGELWVTTGRKQNHYSGSSSLGIKIHSTDWSYRNTRLTHCYYQCKGQDIRRYITCTYMYIHVHQSQGFSLYTSASKNGLHAQLYTPTYILHGYRGRVIRDGYTCPCTYVGCTSWICYGNSKPTLMNKLPLIGDHYQISRIYIPVLTVNKQWAA